MNCFEWRHINCDITYTVDAILYGVTPIQGICTVHARRPSIKWLMRCPGAKIIYPPLPAWIEQRSMFRRQNNTCSRFHVDFFPEYNPLNGIDSTTVTANGSMLAVLTNYYKQAPDGYSAAFPLSKPWDPSDPFYERSMALYNSAVPANKSFTVYLVANFDFSVIPASGTMPEMADGAVAQIVGYDEYEQQIITGTITLGLNFNV